MTNATKNGRFIVGWLGFVALGGFGLWLAVDRAREAASRSACSGHAYQLIIALESYHDEYRNYPPAVVVDDKGVPMHSWRALILPFIGEHDLYKQYRFDEAWDGPNNKKLVDRMPQYFRCTNAPGNSNETNYLAVVGPETAWLGAKSGHQKHISDHRASTIIVVEVANSGINWLEPRDLSFEEAVRGVNPSGAEGGISSLHPGGAIVGFCGGPAVFIRDDIKPETLRALLTANGGEEVEVPQ